MLDQHTWGLCMAVGAGTMAALASLSAKFAVTAQFVHDVCLTFTSNFWGVEMSIICDSVHYILRGICVGGMFVFNALMWTFHTKALQYCPSTVEATITNTGANFLVSAVIGFAIFGESLSILWWLGSCLILGGLILIHKGSQDEELQYNDSKKVK